MLSHPSIASTASSKRTEHIKCQLAGSLGCRTGLSVVRSLDFCVCESIQLLVIVEADVHLVTGYGVEKIGFRKFILGVLFYQCAVTTIFFVAPNVQVLLVGAILAGIAFGVFMSSQYQFHLCSS